MVRGVILGSLRFLLHSSQVVKRAKSYAVFVLVVDRKCKDSHKICLIDEMGRRLKKLVGILCLLASSTSKRGRNTCSMHICRVRERARQEQSLWRE
jgi:hypothetical protein